MEIHVSIDQDKYEESINKDLQALENVEGNLNLDEINWKHQNYEEHMAKMQDCK